VKLPLQAYLKCKNLELQSNKLRFPRVITRLVIRRTLPLHCYSSYRCARPTRPDSGRARRVDGYSYPPSSLDPGGWGIFPKRNIWGCSTTG